MQFLILYINSGDAISKHKNMTHRTDSGRLSSWGIPTALPPIIVIVVVIIVIVSIDLGNGR